ncbi:hypothetical protein AAIG11_07525 [Anoxynatronum sibiricum]|uniref:Uncharacterized protein n=1 Tax=Anoxynatronum sibiricum TaxID=210623 RepID=A0ABU9VT23_9CLOT
MKAHGKKRAAAVVLIIVLLVAAVAGTYYLFFSDRSTSDQVATGADHELAETKTPVDKPAAANSLVMEKIGKVRELQQESQYEEANELLYQLVMTDLETFSEVIEFEALTALLMENHQSQQAVTVARDAINRGMSSPHLEGFAYAFENKVLVDMKTADVTGDGSVENLMIFADSNEGSVTEGFVMVIRQPESGEVLDIEEIDYMGFFMELIAADLTGDGVSDYMFSIHSGGTAGFMDHYAYSLKNGVKVDLLEELQISVNFQFKDHYIVSITCRESGKGIDIRLGDEHQEAYEAAGYYRNGQFVEDGGYFRGMYLSTFPLDHSDQSGLRYATGAVGGLFNSDFVANIEVDYIWEDGGFVATELLVDPLEGEIVSRYAVEKFDERRIAQVNRPYFKYFGLHESTILYEMGTPMDTGYYNGGTYFKYDEIVLVVDHNQEVSAVLFSDLPDAPVGTSFKKIKEIYGEPDAEGISEMDNTWFLMYTIDETYVVDISGFNGPSSDWVEIRWYKN